MIIPSLLVGAADPSVLARMRWRAREAHIRDEAADPVDRMIPNSPMARP